MSSIKKSFQTAFDTMKRKNWDKIYVAVDIHDTIFKGCYNEKEQYEWLGKSKEALRILSVNPKIVLILWTSSHEDNIKKYINTFVSNNILFNYVNENPEVKTTELANFDGKFYFNVGLDDKCGFEPETDWEEIINLLTT